MRHPLNIVVYGIVPRMISASMAQTFGVQLRPLYRAHGSPFQGRWWFALPYRSQPSAALGLLVGVHGSFTIPEFPRARSPRS
jgi:hypothetical protein